MHGLELTLAALADSDNRAAIDAIVFGLKSRSAKTRRGCFRVLTQRTEQRCADELVRHWDLLDDDHVKQLRERTEWLELSVQTALEDVEIRSTAIDIYHRLAMSNSVETLIEIAETSSSVLMRQQATNAILKQAERLGRAARRGRGSPSARRTFLERLAESVFRFRRHKNSGLVDAYLQAALASDSELRRLLQDDTQSAALLCGRLQSSARRGVVQLCADLVGRRDMSKAVSAAIAARDCETLRECLLKAVGSAPNNIVLANLKEIGFPACCRGGEELLRKIDPELRAPLVQIHCATDWDRTQVLQMAATLAELTSLEDEGTVAATIMRAETLEQDDWIDAAVKLASGTETDLAEDANGRLLRRLIDLLDSDHAAVVKAVRHLLEPLRNDDLISRFKDFDMPIRKMVGSIVRGIDPDVVTRVRDGLRHSVLEHRLEAICAADALAVVDLLSDSFKHISKNDHRDARILAAHAMAGAHDEVTERLLEEMLELPDGEVRDAAVTALEHRDEIAAHQG